MVSPNVTLTPWNWRRFALKWLSVGAGIAVIAIVAIGGMIWYNSRPKPNKPWDEGALVAKRPPGFSASKDATRLDFEYSVENTTNEDYQVDFPHEVKILVKTPDGSFSQPLSEDVDHLKLPIFIPAKQTGAITVELAISGLPIPGANETRDEYHERVRAFCGDHLKGIDGFALFDEIRKYRINLPRWLSERPKEDHP